MSARGHVEKKGARWYLRLTRPTADGREQYRIALVSSQPIRSKAQARELADQWLARQAPTTLKPGLNVRFDEFAPKFLAEHAASLRPASRRRYTHAVETLQRELGAKPLPEIDRAVLQAALMRISTRLAVATTRQARTIALLMLRQARDTGYGAHAIHARDIRLPKNSAPELERPSFTADQLERILEASPEALRPLWACMAFAGLRAGEATALEWRDIDFNARVIRVRRNITRAGVQAPKTQGSAAAVPMLPKLEELLLAHQHSSQKLTGLVFATSSGKPINACNLRRRQFQPLLNRLGMRHAGLHALRHSCPALLMAMGLGVELIRRFMRHAHLATTERYTHSSDRDVRAAIDLAISRSASQLSTEVAQSCPST